MSTPSDDLVLEGDLKDIFKNMRLDVHETARSVLFCFACNALLPIEDDATVIPDVLQGRPPACPKCDVAVDVWKNIVLALTLGAGAMATPTGAYHTAILYTLPVGRELSFDLREKGVPANAQLLRVVHRASGEAVAVVDLDATDSGRAPTFAIRVLGVSVVGAEEVVDVQGSTTVTWAEHDADDEGRRSLNRALMALADDRLEETIVPANVAVEVTLNRVLAQHLENVGIGKERAKAFMSDAATYSHQLNVLLPVLLHGTGAPPMSDHLRGLLNRLRDLRNAFGHRGQAKAPLTREVVAECLTAAVFGFHYVRIAAEFLPRRASSSTTTADADG